MRTVTQFPTEAAMLTDVCQTAMILETAGWRRLHHESDTLIQDTWQHDQHPHDIVIRWTANLCDHTRPSCCRHRLARQSARRLARRNRVGR